MSNVQSDSAVGFACIAWEQSRSDVLKLKAFKVLPNANDECCADGHRICEVERSKRLKRQISHHKRYVHVDSKDGRGAEVDFRRSRHVERWTS